MSEDFNYFATSLISSLTAFSLYRVYKIQRSISRKNKQIKKLNNLQIKTPDYQFTNGQQVIIKGTVDRNSNDQRNELITKVDEKTHLQTTYVALFKFNEIIYSNERYADKKDYIIDSKKLLLSDRNINSSILLKGNKNSIIIPNFDLKNYSNVLQITKWNVNKRKLKLNEYWEVFALSCIQAVGELIVEDRSRPGLIRGIDVGKREVQSGLKVGASIMAIGAISIHENGQIFLQSSLLFKDKLLAISNLSSLVEKQQKTKIFWGILAFLGCIYVGRRMYKYEKQHHIIEKVKKWWNKRKNQKSEKYQPMLQNPQS